MKEPKQEDFGWQEPTMYDEGGWMLEGGEEAYAEALELYKKGQDYDCPECMQSIAFCECDDDDSYNDYEDECECEVSKCDYEGSEYDESLPF